MKGTAETDSNCRRIGSSLPVEDAEAAAAAEEECDDSEEIDLSA